jgi:hypothetical protein
MLAISAQVLDRGLPRKPLSIRPGASAPVARWRRNDLGAVLHQRRTGGEWEVDLVVLVHDGQAWRFAAGYLGWQERSRLLRPLPPAPYDPASLLDHLGTTVHPPHVGGTALTVYIEEYLVDPAVTGIAVDYLDGLVPVRDEWRVHPSGLVLVGHTGTQPMIKPRFR